MKQQFTGTYQFFPSTRQITLNGIDLPLERLYLIVNTTRSTPIYNFAVPGLGVNARTFGSGNTSFDVAFDTSTHSANDKLTIIYDDGVANKSIPNVQNALLTDSAGTTATTIRGPVSGAAQNIDTALVVALHPASPAMVGQGGSAVGTSNPLQVSLANTNSNANGQPLIVASPSNAALSVKLTNSANNQIVATKGANEGISSSDLCVMVKNVNLVRGSGDIFVEERRPDICATGEWLGLFRNNTATMYTAQVSSRRMRVTQILFNWMYAGSQTYDLYGEFVFQWFNSSGNFQAELLRVKKFTSGNLYTLNFPNGFIAPTTGGSIRVLRETWGDPTSTINLHWNISLWEEA